ncbi:MAG: hypothetical protein WC528_04110 [Patescibacteria group bacterium]
MNFYDLRNKIGRYKKFSLVTTLEKSSVVNEAYPGQFNLSFTESKWLDKFDNYIDVNEDFFFSTIQPVIRYNDFKNQILTNKTAHKHLALFDMADLVGAGVFVDKNSGNNFTILEIQEFIKLFLELKISLDRVYVSSFAGAKVNEATRGKYKFEKFIPPFEFGRNQWVKNGIPSKNIIPDKSRDTFLALNLYGRPTPWGYRNEIYIKSSAGELIDIATLEHLIWCPVFKDGEIIDLVDYEHFVGLNVIGVERLCMIINDFTNISQCEHIYPLILAIKKVSLNYNYHSAFTVVESVRAVHRIIADIDKPSNLSKTRHTKFNDYLEALYIHLNMLKISDKMGVLEKIFELNAKINPHYPELQSAANNAKKTVEAYFEVRFKNRDC